MVQIPKGKYTKELREQAVRLVEVEGLSIVEASRRLSLPVSSLKNWVYACRKGNLREIGKQDKPLTEMERELARMKKELAEVKLERDLLKKCAAYFAKESR